MIEIKGSCLKLFNILSTKLKYVFENNIGANTVAVTNNTLHRNSIPRTKQKSGGIFISYFL